MAKNSKKSKKNASKNNGLVTSSSNGNNKKKMYPEISAVCDFFCRYLVNSNMFTLEQILNFKTNLREILTKKYKQYTWDKRQPLKANACRSILVLKSTLDPVLIVAGYKAGFLKIEEKDTDNSDIEQNSENDSEVKTSLNSISNFITITPPPESEDDSLSESGLYKKLHSYENSPNLTAVKTNTLEEGQTISFEVFKNIFLKKGEIVLWCDPGSVSYSIDDGQIITLYDKEKEKAEHKKNSSNKNHKSNSSSPKNSKNPSSASLSPYASPYLSHSESTSTTGKKSPLLLPEAAITKKEKKKNKKKEKKNENSSKSSKTLSPLIKNESISRTQSNTSSNNESFSKNLIFDDSLMLLPSNSSNGFSKTNHLSVTDIPSIYGNSPKTESRFFNSLNRKRKIDDNILYSPNFSSKKFDDRKESFLLSIPNNNDIIGFGMNNEINFDRRNNTNDFFYSPMSNSSSTTNRLNDNFTNNAFPFVNLLSRSAVIV